MRKYNSTVRIKTTSKHNWRIMWKLYITS